jgi:hypothetical protein
MTGTGPAGFPGAPAQPAIPIAAASAAQTRIPFRMILGRRSGHRRFRVPGGIGRVPATDPHP